MKIQQKWFVFAMALMAALTVVSAVAFGAGRNSDGVPLVVRSDRDVILSAVRVIRFDQSVARFDSRTGEILRFRGDLKNHSVRSVWEPHVRPVEGRSSGMLELQEAAGSIFLVDVVTGDTWLLRRRVNDAIWDRIDVVR